MPILKLDITEEQNKDLCRFARVLHYENVEDFIKEMMERVLAQMNAAKIEDLFSKTIMRLIHGEKEDEQDVVSFHLSRDSLEKMKCITASLNTTVEEFLRCLVFKELGRWHDVSNDKEGLVFVRGGWNAV